MYDDPHLKWAEWVLNLPFASDKEILAECVRLFEAAHPNVSDRDIMSVTEKEVLADLGRMQLQPTIMDNYRRFVVLTGAKDKYLTRCKLGVCCTIQSYDPFIHDIPA